jgi:hypothetical protein
MLGPSVTREKHEHEDSGSKFYERFYIVSSMELVHLSEGCQCGTDKGNTAGWGEDTAIYTNWFVAGEVIKMNLE